MSARRNYRFGTDIGPGCDLCATPAGEGLWTYSVEPPTDEQFACEIVSQCAVCHNEQWFGMYAIPEDIAIIRLAHSNVVNCAAAQVRYANEAKA